MKDGNEYNKKFYYLKKVSDHKYGFVCSRQFKADGIIDVLHLHMKWHLVLVSIEKIEVEVQRKEHLKKYM